MKFRVYNAAGIVVFKAVSYDALMRQVHRVFMLAGYIPTGCLIVTPTMAGPLDPQFEGWQKHQQTPRRRNWDSDILTLDEN